MSAVEPVHMTLRQRVVRATSWTVAGYAGGQVLRFASNLILTRLLFPEAFGTMSLMYAILIGVHMLTDLGIGQGIVRHARGADPAFLRTAWTLQVGKGLLVGFFMWAISKPVALHYGQPEMQELMGGVALVSVISGLASTKLALMERKIDARLLVMIELGTQALQILITTLLAWHDPSIWSLVWGNLAGAAVKTIASHLLLDGPRDRLGWDRASAHGLFSFSSWIMLSSSITFLSGEGMKLISGSLLDIRIVGLSGLAGTLNMLAWQLVQTLSARVLFPAYSEVARSQDKQRLSRVVEKSRFMQIAPIWTSSLLFVLFGPWVVSVLYDHRYNDAGLILQIMASGMMVAILSGSYTGVLWAMGRAGLSTVMQTAQLSLQCLGMVVGYWLGGQLGVLVGGTVAAWLMYPVTAIMFGKMGLWHPRLDIPVLVASLAVSIGMMVFIDWSPALAW